MRNILVIAAASFLLVSCQSTEGRRGVASLETHSCDTTASRNDVSLTINQFFAALAKDDQSAVQQLTTPSFTAFDVGKRYSAKELGELVTKAHEAGRVMNWNVGPIASRIDCTVASAVWENNGTAGTAQKVEPRSWLESAVLIRQGDRWLLDFFHSTPKDPRK